MDAPESTWLNSFQWVGSWKLIGRSWDAAVRRDGFRHFSGPWRGHEVRWVLLLHLYLCCRSVPQWPIMWLMWPWKHHVIGRQRLRVRLVLQVCITLMKLTHSLPQTFLQWWLVIQPEHTHTHTNTYWFSSKTSGAAEGGGPGLDSPNLQVRSDQEHEVSCDGECYISVFICGWNGFFGCLMVVSDKLDFWCCCHDNLNSPAVPAVGWTQLMWGMFPSDTQLCGAPPLNVAASVKKHHRQSVFLIIIFIFITWILPPDGVVILAAAVCDAIQDIWLMIKYFKKFCPDDVTYTLTYTAFPCSVQIRTTWRRLPVIEGCKVFYGVGFTFKAVIFICKNTYLQWQTVSF